MANSDISRYGQRIVHYFWDPMPLNDEAARLPIWCLGAEYASCSGERPVYAQEKQSDEPYLLLSASQGSEVSSSGAQSLASTADDLSREYATVAARKEEEGGWPKLFLDDFEARIWLTYRSNFPLIPRSEDADAIAKLSLAARFRTQLNNPPGFTSDTGWGCMIRSGQCLLANALLHLRLGRDWRRGCQPLEERKLLSMFSDDPDAPFSVHNFVEHGASFCGKHPGQWFGPSATASCIKALSSNHVASELQVYNICDGSDVYEDEFYNIARDARGICQPTLILVALRLGIDRVTPIYWDAVKEIIRSRNSIGVAGGRPSSSHYFVATQGDHLFYLDPHQTKPAFPHLRDVNLYSKEELDTFHTRRLRRMHLSEMDPSMLVAFLIKDENDWNSWKNSVEAFKGRSIIHINHRTPTLKAKNYERQEAIDEVEILDDWDI